MSHRVFGLLLLFSSLWILASNVRDEIRGTTTVSGMGRSSAAAMKREVSKSDPNSNFRGAMAYHWFVGFGWLGAGWFILSLLRHYDRHDLLSTKFDSTGE